MNPIAERRPADVVVFILDCVRASELPGGERPVPGLPFLEKLHAESTSFPRTIAVAPWTLPSHESLFSGRYPWETRVASGSTVWSLPTALRERGYRTLLLSANPLVGELPGIESQFDHVFVSHWWEPFFRPGLPLGPVRVGEGRRPGRPRALESLHSALTLLPHLLTRFPGALNLCSRWAQRIRRGDAPADLGTAPWLEGMLATWLRTVPASRPICCVINLSEAHEPYLDVERAGQRTDDPDFSVVRQDSVGWVMGGWNPSSREATLLEAMYRGAVSKLDARVAGIAELLERADRWERAVVTLTSDHGQAFGEHGMFFHGHRVDESLVRVPLWVKLPAGDRLPGGSQEWTSHVDVAATLFSEATGFAAPPTSGVSLRSLERRPRGAPVYAESTGIQLERAHLVSAERQALLHRHRLAGYAGSRKAVVESPGGRVLVFDLEHDPDERETLWPTGDWETQSLVESVRTTMAYADQSALPLPRIDRLVSWGYA